MSFNRALKLQQSSSVVARAGFWKLAPERAVTLSTGEAGVLRIAQGHAWVTLDGPHHGPANDWGDVVLHAGEQLQLMPGQHAVVESFGDAVNEQVYFSWVPATVRVQAVPTDESAWCDVLVRPQYNADGLAVSLHSLGRFLGKMAACLAHLDYLVAGRGRVLSPLESNQP